MESHYQWHTRGATLGGELAPGVKSEWQAAHLVSLYYNDGGDEMTASLHISIAAQ